MATLKEDIPPTITWDSCLELSRITSSIQIKALILLQFETGLDAHEILALQYGDIVPFPNEIAIVVTKGTINRRFVFSRQSQPWLYVWLNEHPTRQDNDPLWVDTNPTVPLRPLNKEYIDSELSRIAKPAKLKTPLSLDILHYLSRSQRA